MDIGSTAVLFSGAAPHLVGVAALHRRHRATRPSGAKTETLVHAVPTAFAMGYILHARLEHVPGGVGLSSGPSFVAGAQQIGFGFFIWGVVVTTVPIILSLYIGKYIFRFDDAVVLGCCAGARASTARSAC